MLIMQTLLDGKVKNFGMRGHAIIEDQRDMLPSYSLQGEYN